MLYPNQYKQYSFDTTTNWNARSIFHLFTEFDYQIFGKALIEVTDGRILGGEFEDTRIIKRTSEQTFGSNSGQRTADLILINICATFGPYWAARLSSNHSTNSSGGLYFTVCNNFWVENPEDPGPLSFPIGDGTGGSGGGGGGGSYTTQSGGHWDTIPPCPENGQRVSGSNSQPLECSFIGWQYIWVPDAGAYNPYIYDTVGISSALQAVYPCTYAFLNDSLPNANYLAQLAGAEVFKDSVYMHLTFDTSTTDTQAGQPSGRTETQEVRVESDGITHFKAKIKLNGWYLRNGTKEYMISTIVHEAMHACFQLRWGQYQKWLLYGPPNDIDSAWMKTHYPIYWNTYTQQNIPIGQVDDHEIMAGDYFETFKNIVGSFWNPLAPQAKKDSVLKAICFGGLDSTTAWSLLPSKGIDTCYYRAIQVTAESSLIGTFNTGGGCPNFTTHYADSLKLRPGCN